MKKIALYLLLLDALLLFMCLFSIDVSQADFNHKNTYCTIYCELNGCTHGNRFAYHYGLVASQVKWLYWLPVDYKRANIIVYLFGCTVLFFLSILFF